MYIDEKITIVTKGNEQKITFKTHGVPFYLNTIQKELIHHGLITHQRINDVADTLDVIANSAEGGGQAILTYAQEEMTELKGIDIGDGEHIAEITIDECTQYYDEPSGWWGKEDLKHYVPTGDKNAAPAKDKKEDR
jgi:hypothetical protein